MTRGRLYHWLHGGGWSAAVLILLSIRILFSGQTPVPPLEYLNWALYAVSAIVLTHQLRIRTRHWLDLPFSRAWYRYLAATIVIGFFLGAQVVLVGGAWRLFSGARFPLEFFVSAWINGVFLTLMWTAIYITIVSIRRLAEAKTRALQLELAAKDARLQNLQAQVNPHFLFNGLNTVRALITEEPAKASEAVTWLSQILRYSLRSDATPTVTFAEELEMVTQYLELEKLRFEERLKVHIAVEPAVMEARVPPLLLQTLVENAIKHGIANLPGGGAVIVEAGAGHNRIELTVRNTGKLSNPPVEPGIGLKNTRERLCLLYGTAASCELVERNGEVAATVILPEVRT